jgi:hypothetical protein
MATHEAEQLAYNAGWNKVSDAAAAGYHAPYTNNYDTDGEHAAYRDGFYAAVDYYSRKLVQS